MGVILDPRDRAIFLLAYRRGLRASEVGLLQVGDIDFERGRILLHRLKGSLNGPAVLPSAAPPKPSVLQLGLLMPSCSGISVIWRMARCPKCSSERIVAGEFTGRGESSAVVFKPPTLSFWRSLFGNGVAVHAPAFACQSCGFCWGWVDPISLNRFLSRHCGRGVADNAEGALMAATKLENRGHGAAAIPAYEEVMRRFPGTQEAKDAEASLRYLKKKVRGSEWSNEVSEP